MCQISYYVQYDRYLNHLLSNLSAILWFCYLDVSAISMSQISLWFAISMWQICFLNLSAISLCQTFYVSAISGCQRQLFVNCGLFLCVSYLSVHTLSSFPESAFKIPNLLIEISPTPSLAHKTAFTLSNLKNKNENEI